MLKTKTLDNLIKDALGELSKIPPDELGASANKCPIHDLLMTLNFPNWVCPKGCISTVLDFK